MENETSWYFVESQLDFELQEFQNFYNNPSYRPKLTYQKNSLQLYIMFDPKYKTFWRKNFI